MSKSLEKIFQNQEFQDNLNKLLDPINKQLAKSISTSLSPSHDHFNEDSATNLPASKNDSKMTKMKIVPINIENLMGLMRRLYQIWTISSTSSFRLPYKLLKDLSPQGSLYYILKTIVQCYVAETIGMEVDAKATETHPIVVYLEKICQSANSASTNIRRFKDTVEKNDDKVKNECESLCEKIYQDTVQRGLWHTPKCYLTRRLKKTLKDKLIDSIQFLNGEVVDNVDEATHIIENLSKECTSLSLGNQETNFRVVQRVGDYVELHAIGKPDSEDFWKLDDGNYLDDSHRHNDSDFNKHLRNGHGNMCFSSLNIPHSVSFDWILDSEKYQEWMNEEDYLILNNSLKRKRSETVSGQIDAVQEDSNILGDTEENDPPEEEEDEDEDEEENVEGDEEDEEEGDRNNDEVESIVGYPEIEMIDLDKKIPKRAKKYEYEPFPDPVLFNISHIRYQYSPEQSKILEGNDAVENVNKMDIESIYHENNQDDAVNELEAKTKENDAHMKKENTVPIITPKRSEWFSLNSIHVLEKQAFKDYFYPTEFHKSETSYLFIRNSIIEMYRKYPYKYLSVSACFNKFDQSLNDILRFHNFLEYYGIINYQVRHDLIEEIPSLPSLQSITTYINHKNANFMSTCFTCGQDVNGMYYKCKQPYSHNVCQFCFVSGKFPSKFQSKDFVKVYSVWAGGSTSYFESQETTSNEKMKTNDDPKPLIIKKEGNFQQLSKLKEEDENTINEECGIEWTDEELYKLLTYYDAYGEDWYRIAQYIETKSASECLIKFLNFDSSELLLQKDENKDEVLQQVFAYTENPLMSFLCTISCSLSESFAANGARAALDTLMTKNEQQDDIDGKEDSFSFDNDAGSNVFLKNGTENDKVLNNSTQIISSSMYDSETNDISIIDQNKTILKSEEQDQSQHHDRHAQTRRRKEVMGLEDAYKSAMEAVKESVDNFIQDEEKKIQNYCKDLISLQMELCEKKQTMLKSYIELGHDS